MKKCCIGKSLINDDVNGICVGTLVKSELTSKLAMNTSELQLRRSSRKENVSEIIKGLFNIGVSSETRNLERLYE